MDWVDFVSLMKYMVDTYGVPYGHSTDEDDHEYEYPKTEKDCEGAWFECPDCSEPILFVDWADEFQTLDWELDTICCPICENVWYWGNEEMEED